MRRFFARLANLFRRPALERELSREIASHLALLQEEYERRGFAPDDAQLAARRAYGGDEQAKELHREARSFMWVERLGKDLRYGARSLSRTPGFTALAAITLALGIGANTAIFSVVNAILLQPLPYKDPGRLVTLLHSGSDPVAVANYIDWRDQSRSFAAMGAADYWSPNVTGSGQPEHLWGLKVTQSLMPMLGIEPLLGRLFRPGEDQPGSEHEVIPQSPAVAAALQQRCEHSGHADHPEWRSLHHNRRDAAGVSVRAFLGHQKRSCGRQMCIGRSLTQQRRQQSAHVFARLKTGSSAGAGTRGNRGDYRPPGKAVSRHQSRSPSDFLERECVVR